MTKVSELFTRRRKATVYPDMWVNPDDDPRKTDRVSPDGERATRRMPTSPASRPLCRPLWTPHWSSIRIWESVWERTVSPSGSYRCTGSRSTPGALGALGALGTLTCCADSLWCARPIQGNAVATPRQGIEKCVNGSIPDTFQTLNTFLA